MAVYTLALNPAVKELSQPLLDKHFLRKHGENAYYGQKNTGRFDALLRELPCDCGRTHRVAIKKILLNSGALAKLPELLKELGNFQKTAMICDRNTYSAAGKRRKHSVLSLIPSAWILKTCTQTKKLSKPYSALFRIPAICCWR